MAFRCAAARCNSDSRKKISKYPWMSNVRWVIWPKDYRAICRWKRLVRRGGRDINGHEEVFKVDRRTRLCSRHFDPDSIRANNTATSDPKYFAWNNWGKQPGEMSRDCTDPDFVPSIFPKQKRIKKPTVNPDFVPSVSIFPKRRKNKQPNIETDEVPNKTKKEITSHIPEATSGNTVLSAGKNVEIEWPDLVDLTVQHSQLQEAYADLQAEVDKLSAQNERLKEDLHRVLPRFSYASIKGDNEQLVFLTGLHPLVFDWLVSQVSAKIEGVLPELTTRDHLLMILMKIKLGLCDTDLAYRFGIQKHFVTKICQTWLPALTAVLKPLVAWPSAEIISKSKSNIVQSKFKSCRCIIDCPEFIVTRVGENEDKQESTVKYFASVTPAGAVSFLSSGYSGDLPERRIIKESGFLHLVDPRDEIVANRQIPIRDELASLGAVLHIPDPNNEKQTLKSDSENQRVWTHVKKVTEWWKEFHMLQKVIQEPYADLLDEVLIVCAVLTNVNISLSSRG